MNIPELKVMKDPEVFGEIFRVVKGPYCWGKPYLDLEARSKGMEEGNPPSGCTEAVFNLSKFFVINAFRLKITVFHILIKVQNLRGLLKITAIHPAVKLKFDIFAGSFKGIGTYCQFWSVLPSVA